MEAEPPGHAFPGRAWGREVWTDFFQIPSFETVSRCPSYQDMTGNPAFCAERRHQIVCFSSVENHWFSNVLTILT
jgi:hypothetical protein